MVDCSSVTSTDDTVLASNIVTRSPDDNGMPRLQVTEAWTCPVAAAEKDGMIQLLNLNHELLEIGAFSVAIASSFTMSSDESNSSSMEVQVGSLNTNDDNDDRK